MTKPFTPKMEGARPKLSAALQAPTLNQFTPRMIAALQAVKQNKKPKKTSNSVGLGLTGNF